jgi:hypothetical protein
MVGCRRFFQRGVVQANGAFFEIADPIITARNLAP